jgi:hypothetical protein
MSNIMQKCTNSVYLLGYTEMMMELDLETRVGAPVKRTNDKKVGASLRMLL